MVHGSQTGIKPFLLFRHALDIREHYERKLERANNLYMELSAIMLQLEVREKELIKYVCGNGVVHAAVCTQQSRNSDSFLNWTVARVDLVSPDKLQRLGNCWPAGRDPFGVNSCRPLSVVTDWEKGTFTFGAGILWPMCEGNGSAASGLCARAVVPAACRRSLGVAVSFPSRAGCVVPSRGWELGAQRVPCGASSCPVGAAGGERDH